jgi:hypothetical protein
MLEPGSFTQELFKKAQLGSALQSPQPEYPAQVASALLPALSEMPVRGAAIVVTAKEKITNINNSHLLMFITQLIIIVMSRYSLVDIQLNS